MNAKQQQHFTERIIEIITRHLFQFLVYKHYFLDSPADLGQSKALTLLKILSSVLSSVLTD